MAIATLTVSLSATVIAEIASDRVVPVPLNAPLVAPVTVISEAARPVGSSSNVSVNDVVVVVPVVPLADRPLNAISFNSATSSAKPARI
ncbi:hypothetical protein H206_05642 [Candidatus Electrothrix aarhusensis]|uniref:Uncharacterized protein n=1 Tax=Candidatus Electrothrix aarhusensis TaxID=1859131 RepID=A0A444J3U5_9BACT|nr:hypothetical protein H206_05642 [Candidatus Electrothrix aarhusensis]